MNTILVFAGAGASKATSPEKYPTTIEFLAGLDASIRSDPLFAEVEAYLGETVADKTLDIELILWRLQELRTFCETASDRAQFPGWLITTGRLFRALSRQNENLGHFPSITTSAIHALDTLISRINRQVYDFYSQLPTPEELAETWTPLLAGCQQLGVKTELVSTNYDMVIESALDANPVSDTGWRGSVVRTLDVDLWTQGSGTDSRGLLTKLHGSVNWSKKDGRIFISDPHFKGSHQNHAIIYPGFKGRPADSYFLSFHEHFRRAVRASKAIVFIGFAFRDQYINDICGAAISPGTTIFSINRQEIDLPFEGSRHIKITGSFDRSAVSKCIAHLKDALGGA